MGLTCSHTPSYVSGSTSHGVCTTIVTKSRILGANVGCQRRAVSTDDSVHLGAAFWTYFGAVMWNGWAGT